MSLRALVCGGRDFADKNALFDALDWLLATEGVAAVIHGQARGADLLSAIWALARNIPEIPFPANWTEHGKGAGHIRNQEMLDRGRPDIVVAFPGGRGTADMVARAERAGVRVWRP